MKEIYINGIITASEYQNEFDQEQGYSFEDLKREIGDEVEVTVYIDSPGGMVEEGLKIYDFLKQRTVTTIALNASSIASIIFLAGKKRMISPNAQMIIHNAWLRGNEIDDDMIVNANNLEELKQEFEKIDAELVSIYKEVTGMRETKLLALMAEDTDIAQNAIEYGFATGVYQEEERAKAVANCVMFNAHYMAMNKVKPNLNNDNMANEATNEKLNAIEKALKGLSNMIFGNAKNMAVELEDGTQIFVFSEDGEFEGKRAVIADEEGRPTEENAPAGTHTLRDGRQIVVGEGGIIEAVQEAPDAEAMEKEMEAMEDEKKKLMEEKEALQAKVEAITAEMDEKEKSYKDQFNALSEEIKALKEEVIGETNEIENKTKAIVEENEDWSKLSVSEKFRRRMVAKAQNENL